ncbi:phosphate ABC transporter permease subunit PstC [Paraphotobacterium marinum]|uniref:Phosphate transport system permease protein n=1 Tax=Paraphotobacterium marinum TaxID=1755811 RepID=A0A220VDT3_9GAMM|nr:phosphate ABC transporter permease subunit PstC [Paraphotobacterium marinum]ASK78578.1 phosphate ABC transporter permease subunit PstC [Paraphotobacterium marinum]
MSTYSISKKDARIRKGSGTSYFYSLTKTLSFVSLILLIAIVISIYLNSKNILSWDFIISTDWNPPAKQFGALTAIAGTLISAVIAIVFAVPLSILCAFFCSELAPRKLAILLRGLIDMLAGIPSIIFGFWGLIVFVPFMRDYICPFVNNVLGSIPLIGSFFQGPPIGIGMLTAGLVLAIMIIPIMTAMIIELLNSVPMQLKEAAFGLGSTRYEVASKVLFPYIKSGVLGSSMLGLGRALGETMAVTFVIGNAHVLPTQILMPATTIASSIANEFAEATSAVHANALMATGFLLFVITIAVILLSRFILAKYSEDH